MIEAPTTQERYATAIHGSHLRVEGENVRGPMDLIIAAGWCKSKFGSALMRLQAEWDGAERLGVKVPIKPTKRDILRAAQLESIKQSDGTRVLRITTASTEAAKKRLEKSYITELAKVKRALKSLPEVITQLEIKMLLDGQSAELAAPLLLYWLDPVCKVCNGRKYKLKPGTVQLSERACSCCDGNGAVKPPAGNVGLELLDLINDCASRAGGEVRGYCKH